MARTPKPQTPASKPGERNENSEVRKLRNRMSQKAFRARQAMRIKELEERLQIVAGAGAATTTAGGPDIEWVTQLQDRNAALRDQLLQCHKKFTSLQASMKALADATALALDIEGIDESDTQKICGRCKTRDLQTHKRDGDGDGDDKLPSLETGTVQGNEQLPPEGEGDGQINPDLSAPNSHRDEMLSLFTYEPDTSADVFQPSINLNYFSPTDMSEPMRSTRIEEEELQQEQAYINERDFLPDMELIKPIPSPMTMDLVFSQDLGPNKYSHILEMSPLVSKQSGISLKRTNSTFSDHIDALEYCISRNWSKMSSPVMVGEMIAQSIQSMLWTFINISWQTMTAWHTHTNAHVPLKDLMEWRIYKTPDVYHRIVPPYRPTKLQMRVSHPSIIDWVPWPSMRDKLILHHSANPRLDELISDIGNSYVVQADLSRLVRCAEPVLGYVGVWDLVRAIAPEATGSQPLQPPCGRERDSFDSINVPDLDPDPSPSQHLFDSSFNAPILPSENVDALFSNRTLAKQAFKSLSMDKGTFHFRLDPAFFERHPELYYDDSNSHNDHNHSIMAQGVPLRPSRRRAMRVPRDLDAAVLGQYQEMAKYLVDRMVEERREG